MNNDEQPLLRIESGLQSGEYGMKNDEKTRISNPLSAMPVTQSSGLSRQSLEVHIEELVLHGFEPADRYLIGEAVERELTRLFNEQGAPPAIRQDGEIAHLGGGAFEVKPGSTSEVIGLQLAKAIYGGFGQ